MVALQRNQAPVLGDARQHQLNDLPACRPLIHIVADRDDDSSLAAGTRLDAGQRLAEQIVSAVNVRNDIGQAHTAARVPRELEITSYSNRS